MPERPWKPLLGGRLLDQAGKALQDISGALESGPPPHLGSDRQPEEIRIRTACLGDGHAGQALYFGYLHQACGGEGRAGTGITLLDRAIEAVSSQRMGPTLYTGFPGIAWAANHLAGRLYPQAEEDPYRETDDLLHDYIRRIPWPFHLGVIDGLAGIGVYALERLPRPTARRCLEAVVDRLEEVSERRTPGVAWVTPPEIEDAYWRRQRPRGSYDLGLAHGIPGVVALLAALCEADVARAKAGPLLEAAVPWILDQSLPPGSPSRFPNWHIPEKPPAGSRLAWCYGDLGVATSLLWAAAVTGRTDWLTEALATARAAGRRPMEHSGVWDACICHGMAGVAHIFNRLHQASGDEALAEAALYWYEKLLEARTPGQGYGGYLFERSDGQTRTWAEDPGFLGGTAGVGLALLAATTAVEPGWDRALLTCIPPIIPKA